MGSPSSKLKPVCGRCVKRQGWNMLLFVLFWSTALE